MSEPTRRDRGRLFEQAPELDDRVRRGYPSELMADLVHITGVAGFPNAEIEIASFEAWNDRGRRFDLVLAASSWHWIDPSIGWRRAHEILNPGGWMAILGHVVIRRPDEPELYEETAGLHHRYVPDNPDWGHPPTEAEVRVTSTGWGPPNEDLEGFFGPTTVRWYR